MAERMQIRDQAAQPTLAIRTKTTIAELPQLIGMSYGRIASYLGRLGEAPAGAPFAAYHNVSADSVDVELGFPVFAPLPGSEDIRAGQLPEGQVLSCLYRGTYDGIAPLYAEMQQWCADNGYEYGGVSYEYYLNSPADATPGDLLTRVDMLVHKR